MGDPSPGCHRRGLRRTEPSGLAQIGVLNLAGGGEAIERRRTGGSCRGTVEWSWILINIGRSE